MAEVIPITFSTLYEDRPPKLDHREATYMLERGPYIGRLRAKERLLEAVLAFTIDEETRSIMNERQLDEIKDDIVRLESELVQFETVFDWDDFPSVDEPTADTSHAVSEQTEDNKIIISPDFLKRKDTAVCSETDPEIFFPEKGGSTRAEKAICEESCDLTDECLMYALERKERFGIWGGMSERERRKLLKSQVSS